MEEIVRQVLSRFPTASNCRPPASLGNAGGLSGARFWRVKTPSGDMILRRWPQEHPGPNQLRFIHSVLRFVHHRGFHLVPLPHLSAQGESFVQCAAYLWELAPWMPGRADFHRMPTDARLSAAMLALAEFHQAGEDFEQGGPAVSVAPAILQRHQRLAQLQHADAAGLIAAVQRTSSHPLAPISERFLQLAVEEMEGAARGLAPLADCALPIQPCIRDVWSDHVLFEGDRVGGIIDFGALRSDTPATDVARLLASLAGDDSRRWKLGIEAYHSRRMLSADQRQAVAALDLAGTILGGCNWIRWIFVDGRTFDSFQVVQQRLESLRDRLTFVAKHGPVWRP